MDEGFFDCFEATKGTRGEVKATVLIVKSSLLMEVRITIEGMVKATCDRCLGEVNLPVSGVMNLYVKQNGREEGNEDDYIILSPEDDYLDEYVIEEDDKPIDPRWNELKKLINN